ncbi:hypothetical protein RHSIM_Rhsim11G0143600 [Rhododendron simsii]|uniref:Integrase catalytic domain-containing protein n=1 Tax=Rhododendron simsii TaxID=118357 RepID=A0A834G829_RHOSS|nr:hypothetical protein RHSIM_Rhsim11G0143600 [Rhododendron simsii]
MRVMSEVYEGVCGEMANQTWIPAADYHVVVKPWPFRDWALDETGKIYPHSSGNHTYILVAVDYFTKWAEAVPLKSMDQQEVIKVINERIIHSKKEATNDIISGGGSGLTPTDYTQAMLIELENLDEVRLYHMLVQKRKVARSYHKRVRRKSFSEGDLVWKAVFPWGGGGNSRYGKWSPTWKGRTRFLESSKVIPLVILHYQQLQAALVLLSFSGASPSNSATSPSAIVPFKGNVSLKNSWQAASSNLLPSSTLQVQSPGEVSFADLMDPIELEGLIARIEKPPIQSTPLSSNETAVHIQRGLLISLQSSTTSIDDIISRTNGIVSVLKSFNVDLSPLYEKVKALVKYFALWAKVAETFDRDVSLGELEAQCEEKKAKFEGLTRSYGEILASASKLTEHVSSLEEEITRTKELLKNLEFELFSCKVKQSSSLSDLVKFSENISKSQMEFNAAMDAVEERKKKSVLFDSVKEALDDARASLVALSSL